jgi:hypothetical protein
MDDNRARQGLDPLDADGTAGTIGEPLDVHADDPLGDEAAFPSTWQEMAGADANRRD